VAAAELYIKILSAYMQFFMPLSPPQLGLVDSKSNNSIGDTIFSTRFLRSAIASWSGARFGSFFFGCCTEFWLHQTSYAIDDQSAHTPMVVSDPVSFCFKSDQTAKLGIVVFSTSKALISF